MSFPVSVLFSLLSFFPSFSHVSLFSHALAPRPLSSSAPVRECVAPHHPSRIGPVPVSSRVEAWRSWGVGHAGRTGCGRGRAHSRAHERACNPPPNPQRTTERKRDGRSTEEIRLSIRLSSSIFIRARRRRRRCCSPSRTSSRLTPGLCCSGLPWEAPSSCRWRSRSAALLHLGRFCPFPLPAAYP